MNEFPQLKTGAVAQYPAQRITQFSTQVMQFLDGSEQRYREFSGPLRRWVIDLTSLDDEEMDPLVARIVEAYDAARPPRGEAP